MSKPHESYESGVYLENNPSWDEEDSEWKAGNVAKMMEYNNLSPDSIVEVGCGAGGVLAELHEAYPDIAYFGYAVNHFVVDSVHHSSLCLQVVFLLCWQYPYSVILFIMFSQRYPSVRV